jgi:hypothetical protein
MPFYLQAPIQGKTKFWYVRGTHGSINIDAWKKGGRSTRATTERCADRIKQRWERLAEYGYLPDGTHITVANAPVEPVNPKDVMTFADAAAKYIEWKGLVEGSKPWRFINRMVEHKSPKHGVLGKLLCKNVVDDVVLAAASECFGATGKAATKNRGVYSPIIAVLNRAGFGEITANIKRPVGWNSYAHCNFIQVGDELDALLTAADQLGDELGLFCEMLAYTPTRYGMMLGLRVCDVNLDDATAYFRGLGVDARTKNGESQLCALTERLVVRLRAHVAGKDPNALVFSRRGKTTRNFQKALRAVPGLFERLEPRHRGYHVLRHTYGTAMTRLGVNLLDTGGWKSPQAAALYKHVVSPEARRVAELPSRPLLAPVPPTPLRAVTI